MLQAWSICHTFGNLIYKDQLQTRSLVQFLFVGFASQICAARLFRFPATKMLPATARRKATPVHASLASREMDTTVQVFAPALKWDQQPVCIWLYSNLCVSVCDPAMFVYNITV